MEDPGNAQAGLAQCLTLSTVPPAMTQVADAECEVETYNGFRLGGGSRLAVYVNSPAAPHLFYESCDNIDSSYQLDSKALPAAVDGAWVYDGSGQTALLTNFPDLPQVFTLQLSFSMSYATYYVPIFGTWHNGGGNQWGIWKSNNAQTLHFNCGKWSETTWTFEWDTWYTIWLHRDSGGKITLSVASEGQPQSSAQVVMTESNCPRPAASGGIYSVGGYCSGCNDAEIFTGKIRNIAVYAN